MTNEVDTVKTVSLDALDATRASGEAFEFPFLDSSGEPTGIYFSVLGGQSETVTSEVARLVNDRRRKEAAREVQRRLRPNSKAVDFETFESDVAFGQRLAAVRLVGWRGIAEPCTADNALKLCMTNREAAAQITLQSDEMANFLKS